MHLNRCDEVLKLSYCSNDIFSHSHFQIDATKHVFLLKSRINQQNEDFRKELKQLQCSMLNSIEGLNSSVKANY